MHHSYYIFFDCACMYLIILLYVNLNCILTLKLTTVH